MPRPKDTSGWELRDNIGGPCILNGPVKRICVKCKKSEILWEQEPRVCDNCLNCDEAKKIVEKYEYEKKIRSR